MPTAVGPNTYGEENLVFGYDLGDSINSYKGEPAYNRHNYDKSVMSQTGFDAWGCYDGNNTPYHTWGISQTKTLVNLPGPDGKDTNAMLYHNITGGGFGPTDWGTGVPAAIITAGNKITLQGWVKAADAASVGKTVTPYIYVYVNGGGAQATSTNFTLTANWQLVSTTMTVNADGNNSNGFVYFFTGGGSNIRMYLTKTAVLSGIGHAVQWLPGGQTRSATQGLIDLTGNSTIDLTNVSFDSNAQMTFDGSNDYVQFPYDLTGLTTLSLEAVFLYGGSELFIIQWGSSYYSGGHLLRGLGTVSDQLYCDIGGWSDAAKTTGAHKYLTGGTLVSGRYYHAVMTVSDAGAAAYLNGVLVSSLTSADSFYGLVALPNADTGLRNIGRSWYRLDGGVSYCATTIPLVKAYNRALTASEVASNYKAIKGRFNI